MAGRPPLGVPQPQPGQNIAMHPYYAQLQAAHQNPQVAAQLQAAQQNPQVAAQLQAVALLRQSSMQMTQAQAAQAAQRYPVAPTHPQAVLPQQAMPQQEAPPPKPKNQVPKKELGIMRMDQDACRSMTQVSPAFWNFLESWSKTVGVTLTPDAGLALAMGLKMRMRQITQQCVWYAKRRVQEHNGREKIYTDVPMARFAMLEAERRIAKNPDSRINQTPQTDLPPAIERLRSEVVSVLDGGQKRDEFATIGSTQEQPPADSQLDWGCVMAQVPQRQKVKAVTREDVRACLENDSHIGPNELQMRLSLQVQRIARH